VELYLNYPTCVHRRFYHVAVLRKCGALPPSSPTCVHWTFYHVGELRNCEALPPPSPACVHWTFYHVAIWELMELYLHSLSCVHRTFYHVARLRMCAALPKLVYMCSLNVLRRGWFKIIWKSTSTPLHLSTEILITQMGWEKLELYTTTSTPLQVSTELFIY